MSSLSIGLSALQVNQRLLSLTGENIANANTPNYQRQIAELAGRVYGAGLGMGVEITDISRATNRTLEDAIRSNTVSASDSATQLEGLEQLQAYLAPGDGSLRDALDIFFSEAVKLSVNPADVTQRRVVLAAAESITDRINTAAENLNQLRRGLFSQVMTGVAAVNSLAEQIAEFNQRIQVATTSGHGTSVLIGNRDQAIAKLAELIDVRVSPTELGLVNVHSAGILLVAGNTTTPVHAGIDIKNQLVVTAGNAGTPLNLQGGNLAGLLTLHNTTVPSVRARLDAFTQGLITEFDRIQATGLGLNGPMSALASTRSVANVNQPLGVVNLQPPPRAGELAVTVTDFATGVRTLHRLTIDPATQSLADVASVISTIPHVQGVVDPQTGTLHIMAAAGFGFDFTGNFSTLPDTQAITGTTAASFAGRYTGIGSDSLTFQFTGAGTIGATPNLGLEVRNAAGTLLASLNVGLGYSPGSDLPTVQGVTLRLAGGTANIGDSFSLNVVADSDSASLLPAIGMNSFFTGTNAGDLRVRSDLLAHPDRLALSLSGQPGDAANLGNLVALRDRPVLNGNSQSLTQSFDAIIGDIGVRVQDEEARTAARESLGRQLEAELQSLVGVDPNEEVIRLVQYQRAFQSSARYVSVVNDMLDQLFNLI